MKAGVRTPIYLLLVAGGTAASVQFWMRALTAREASPPSSPLALPARVEREVPAVVAPARARPTNARAPKTPVLAQLILEPPFHAPVHVQSAPAAGASGPNASGPVVGQPHPSSPPGPIQSTQEPPAAAGAVTQTTAASVTVAAKSLRPRHTHVRPTHSHGHATPATRAVPAQPSRPPSTPAVRATPASPAIPPGQAKRRGQDKPEKSKAHAPKAHDAAPAAQPAATTEPDQGPGNGNGHGNGHGNGK